jgi:hypothetical protein
MRKLQSPISHQWAAAACDDVLSFRNLSEATLELVHRDADRAGEMSHRVFVRRTHVQNDDRVCPRGFAADQPSRGVLMTLGSDARRAQRGGIEPQGLFIQSRRAAPVSVRWQSGTPAQTHANRRPGEHEVIVRDSGQFPARRVRRRRANPLRPYERWFRRVRRAALVPADAA